MSRNRAKRRKDRSFPGDLALFDVVLLLAGAAGLVIVLQRNSLLPPRFFYDGLRIQGIASSQISAVGDGSFASTATLYRLLGLANHATAASVLGYLFAVFAIVLVRRKLGVGSASLGTLVLLVVTIFFSAIYLGYYSKDVFVVGLVILSLILPRSFWGELLLLAAVAAFAESVRSYWFLVLALYLFYRFALARGFRWKGLTFSVLIALVAVSLAVAFFLGVNPDYFRTAVNDVRLLNSEDASSMIEPLLPGSTLFLGVMNIVVTFFTLLVPIPLLLRGGVYYILIFVVFVVIWWLFGRSLRSGFRVLARGQDSARVGARMIALILAFVSVQSLFEPDYGSVIRHLTPMLILFIAVAGWSAQASAEEAFAESVSAAERTVDRLE